MAGGLWEKLKWGIYREWRLLAAICFGDVVFLKKGLSTLLKACYDLRLFREGEMPERLNGPDSKSVGDASPTRVRIPISPPESKENPLNLKGFFFF